MNSKSEPQYTCDFEKFCNNDYEVAGKEDEEGNEEKAAEEEIIRLRSRLNELELRKKRTICTELRMSCSKAS